MAPKRKSASAAPTPASALEQLQKTQNLQILAIAETLSPKEHTQPSNKRNSAASEDSEQHGDTHPAALEADLSHYKVPFLPGNCLLVYIDYIVGALQQTALQLC